MTAPRPEDHIRTGSLPGDLRITDMRTATVAWDGWRFPIIRIDTNQGISGYGEVRDGASKTYALMLKSRLLGENPRDRFLSALTARRALVVPRTE